MFCLFFFQSRVDVVFSLQHYYFYVQSNYNIYAIVFCVVEHCRCLFYKLNYHYFSVFFQDLDSSVISNLVAMSFGVLKFNVIFSCVNSSLKVLILRQTRKYAKYLWAKRFVTVCPTMSSYLVTSEY